MGQADIVTKEYMREPHVFADAFNFLLYDGRQVIKPSELKELDTTEMMYIFGGGAPKRGTGVQKYRDILKYVTVMSGAKAAYILLGVENQTDIHYAMPVKNMVYDAMQYAEQVSRIASDHRNNSNKGTMSSAEFLSGFTREDRLQPVITLVRISQNDFKKFASSLREVLNYIKYSKDEKGLARLLEEDERLKKLEVEAARVIETITHTDFAIDEKAEVVNVCQAVEDMMKTREQKGRELGQRDMLIQLVRKGLLSVADAASEAGLSCEAFEREMKSGKN